MEFWRKIPAFLWPGKENFQKIKDEPVKTTLIYMIAGIVFFAAANILFNLEAFLEYAVEDILYMMLITIFSFFIMLFITSVISFGVAKLFGVKEPYMDMARTVIYSFTPAYLFGWLSSIGFIGIALSFGNLFAGVAGTFKLNVWKSLVVAATPLLAFFALFMLFVYFLFNSGAATV